MQQRRNGYGMVVLKAGVSLILVGWLLKTIEWGQIVLLLQNAELIWIIVAFLWVVVSVLVSAYKWQLICRGAGLKLPLKVLWNIYWAGLFFNNFMPSSVGGDALRIYWAGKYAGDLPGTGASVVVERLLATIGLALLGILAASFATIKIPYLQVFFVATIFVTGAVLALIFSPDSFRLLGKLFSRYPKAVKLLHSLSIHGNRLRGQKGFVIKSLLLSVAFQFCVVMVNYSIFQTFHLDQISLLQACLVIPATSVAAMIPFGINGYGTREGAYIVLFAYFGVTREAAITMSIVFAVIVSISSLWGGWIWFRNGQEVKGVDLDETDNRREGSEVLC